MRPAQWHDPLLGAKREDARRGRRCAEAFLAEHFTQSGEMLLYRLEPDKVSRGTKGSAPTRVAVCSVGDTCLFFPGCFAFLRLLRVYVRDLEKFKPVFERKHKNLLARALLLANHRLGG